MGLGLFTLAEVAPAAPAGGGGNMLVMMALMFGVMYFLVIRPQKRRERERKAMIANVKSGDRVMLASGILGEVTNVKENSLLVKIAENTKVEVVRGSISQVLAEDETPSEIEPKK
jgi:preprotein translocase subunit YajC